MLGLSCMGSGVRCCRVALDSRRRVGGNMSGNGQSAAGRCVSSCMSPARAAAGPRCLLPRAEGARCALRRQLLHRRDQHRHLLPAGLPGAHAAARELPLLRPRRAGRGAGFRPLPALPARAGAAGAALVAAGRERRAGPAGGAPARRAGAWGGESPRWNGSPQRLGISDRHLRRIFGSSWACRRCSTCRRAGCCAPSSCWPTRACRSRRWRWSSGFGSVRRFNAAFTAHYG